MKMWRNKEVKGKRGGEGSRKMRGRRWCKRKGAAKKKR